MRGDGKKVENSRLVRERGCEIEVCRRAVLG
jgi:hypothetical protein